MQISQNLKLRQSQSLVMTPQLQQAIKLLQLNNLELCDLVEKELEENPFLEKDEQTFPMVYAFSWRHRPSNLSVLELYILAISDSHSHSGRH